MDEGDLGRGGRADQRVEVLVTCRLCGVSLGPLSSYSVMLCSVGQVLSSYASHQRIRWDMRRTERRNKNNNKWDILIPWRAKDWPQDSCIYCYNNVQEEGLAYPSWNQCYAWYFSKTSVSQAYLWPKIFWLHCVLFLQIISSLCSLCWIYTECGYKHLRE